jgi:hypothetical protein
MNYFFYFLVRIAMGVIAWMLIGIALVTFQEFGILFGSILLVIGIILAFCKYQAEN